MHVQAATLCMLQPTVQAAHAWERLMHCPKTMPASLGLQNLCCGCCVLHREHQGTAGVLRAVGRNTGATLHLDL